MVNAKATQIINTRFLIINEPTENVSSEIQHSMKNFLTKIISQDDCACPIRCEEVKTNNIEKTKKQK